MTSMTQDFKGFKFFLDISVLLVTFEIIFHYHKIVREELMVSNGFELFFSLFLLSFGFRLFLLLFS